jgi:hypothetical protein
MNILLLMILAVSGVIELAVGLWALAMPASFASMWLEIPQLSASGQFRGPVQVLLFVIGWAGIAMSALHLLAFAWLRSEKREAYRLSIALGSALTFLGVATFLYGTFGQPPLANSLYLLLVDGLRGVVLGLAGVLAMNAPATVRELRLPPRREQERPQRSRQGSLRDSRRGGERDRGRDRGREPSRGRDREGDRRGAPGGRDLRRGGEPGREGRPLRGPRDGSRRERGPGGERRDRGPDLVAPAARETGVERTPLPPPLQPRPLPVRDEGEGDRWQQGRRRPGAPPETEDVRSLGVVVTGRPPQSIVRDLEGQRGPRTEAGAPAEEKPQLPRAPMVPRVRTEIPPARPLPPDPSSAEGERSGEDRDRDRDRDRRRRRRRSGSSRSSGEDRMRRRDDSRAPEEGTREAEPPASRFSSPESSYPGERYAQQERVGPRDRVAPQEDSGSAEPSEAFDRYAPPDQDSPPDRLSPPDRQDPSERISPPDRIPPPAFDESRRGDLEGRGASDAIGPVDEPIDMISSFGGSEEPGSATTQTPSAYGHHRRAWTPHRKGKASKPRETKIRRTLGGGIPRDEEPTPPQPYGRPGPSAGRIGLVDGIGPIDLDDTEPNHSGGEEA